VEGNPQRVGRGHCGEARIEKEKLWASMLCTTSVCSQCDDANLQAEHSLSWLCPPSVVCCPEYESTPPNATSVIWLWKKGRAIAIGRYSARSREAEIYRKEANMQK